MKTQLALAFVTLGLAACSQNEQSNEAPGEGEKLVLASIDAHGGIKKWRENGQLQFRWKYFMTDKDKIIDSVQTVDPNTLAVTHSVPESDVRFGMIDGTAWIHPADAEFASPPRFWALTPTYFIGIPFVFADESCEFELLSEPKEFEGKAYTQVKVTYGEDAGDSPDDYYVLLIDPETKVTRGAYYIVTHPLVAKNGPGPEKLITLDGLTDVGGTMLASGHTTYKMEDGKILDQMRRTEVSGVKWLPAGEVDLSIPEGAKEL